MTVGELISALAAFAEDLPVARGNVIDNRVKAIDQVNVEMATKQRGRTIWITSSRARTRVVVLR